MVVVDVADAVVAPQALPLVGYVLFVSAHYSVPLLGVIWHIAVRKPVLLAAPDGDSGLQLVALCTGGVDPISNHTQGGNTIPAVVELCRDPEAGCMPHHLVVGMLATLAEVAHHDRDTDCVDVEAVEGVAAFASHQGLHLLVPQPIALVLTCAKHHPLRDMTCWHHNKLMSPPMILFVLPLY